MDVLKAKFTKYMKIALKNDSIDYFRMQERKNKIVSISLREIDDLKVLDSPDSEFDTFSFAQNDLLEIISDKKLYDAVKSLTLRQQKTIGLYIQGYSSEEISRMLNVSVGTVKSTMFQIKRKLKKYI